MCPNLTRSTRTALYFSKQSLGLRSNATRTRKYPSSMENKNKTRNGRLQLQGHQHFALPESASSLPSRKTQLTPNRGSVHNAGSNTAIRPKCPNSQTKQQTFLSGRCLQLALHLTAMVQKVDHDQCSWALVPALSSRHWCGGFGQHVGDGRRHSVPQAPQLGVPTGLYADEPLGDAPQGLHVGVHHLALQVDTVQ